MYYINQEQIDSRLQFIPDICRILETVAAAWDGEDAVSMFAQERALHLAIETVTDVGSLLIDGFIMREASSYEDIIDVLYGEKLFPQDRFAVLFELVKLRKPLVQHYIEFPREQLHKLTSVLPDVLTSFADDVKAFITKELA
jgi:uncharacterized protein YutE (UPF0331/DUF86 family)